MCILFLVENCSNVEGSGTLAQKRLSYNIELHPYCALFPFSVTESRQPTGGSQQACKVSRKFQFQFQVHLYKVMLSTSILC